MTSPEPRDRHVRNRMRTQARRNTKPELALRRELHRRGLRYRVDTKIEGLKRKRPDIVFTRRRVAVFVDGCFWHRCPEHGTLPKNNAEWWAAKLEANVSRDRGADQTLADMGWAVVRVWEHEQVTAAADRVSATLRSRSLKVAKCSLLKPEDSTASSRPILPLPRTSDIDGGSQPP